MSRRNNHSLRSEALHNLQVAKRWTRLLVYPGVTLLIPIDLFVLHLPLLESILSHVGGYLVAALAIELGYAWGERVRQQAEYPNVLRTQLGSPANVRDACYAAASILVELLRANAAVLVLFHRESNTPEVLVSHGIPPGVLKFNAEQAPLIEPFFKCAETRSIFVEPLLPSHPYFPVFGSGNCRVAGQRVCQPNKPPDRSCATGHLRLNRLANYVTTEAIGHCDGLALLVADSSLGTADKPRAARDLAGNQRWICPGGHSCRPLRLCGQWAWTGDY